MKPNKYAILHSMSQCTVIVSLKRYTIIYIYRQQYGLLFYDFPSETHTTHLVDFMHDKRKKNTDRINQI